MTRLLRSSKFWLLGRALLLVIGFSIAGVSQAQTTQKRAALAPEEEPVFHEYRGVKIGWVADDVRKKLGSPANKGDEQDFYVYCFRERSDAELFAMHFDGELMTPATRPPRYPNERRRTK